MVAQQRRNYDVPMGTSLTPLETLTVESFFLAALTTISKTLFGKVSDSILIWNDLKEASRKISLLPIRRGGYLRIHKIITVYF